jgi:predicted secreted protein
MEQSAPDVSVSLEVCPQPLRSGGEAEWEIRLQNDGAQTVRFTFSTGQLGDVALEQRTTVVVEADSS